jgi:hypothetical protein
MCASSGWTARLTNSPTRDFARFRRIRAAAACALAALAIQIAGCPLPSDLGNCNDNCENANVNAGTGNLNAGGNGNANAGGNPDGNGNQNGGSGGNGNANGGNSNANSGVAAPTVSAGADQTAEDGVTVTLVGTVTGANSVQWTQVGGIDVTLSNPNATTTAFTTPAFSGDLEFELTATGDGGTASDRVRVTVAAAPVLIVPNLSNRVLSFRMGPTTTGDVPPRTDLTGDQTGFDVTSAAIVDRAFGLVVCSTDAPRLDVFENGANAGGNRPPLRSVDNPNALLNNPQDLAYDFAADRLYVANFDGVPTVINRYDGVTTLGFGPGAAPSGQIVSPAVVNPRGLHLSAAGELWVANAGNQTVAVFSNPAGIGALVNANRVITATALQGNQPMDMVVDGNDRLLVISATAPRILVFEEASTAEGDFGPDAILTIDGAQSLTGIALDNAGRVYLADGPADAIYVLESLPETTQTITPARTIAGPATLLSNPQRLFVHQR